MKKIVSGFITVLCCSVTLFSQELAPLKPGLALHSPADIFPPHPEKDYVFSNSNKSDKPATFVAKVQTESSTLFSTEVFGASKSHYGVQSSWKSAAGVKKGDVLLARFSIRSIYARQESGEAVVYFFVQQAEAPHEKSVIVDISAGPEWKAIDIPFIALQDMDKGEAAICFSFGALAQKVEITSLQVLNFGQKISIAELPVTRFSYAGREPGAAWRKSALHRIEELRTAPLTVQVTDAAGKPIKGASVNASLVQSDFIWGTAVKESLLASELPGSDNYRRLLKELFNTAVIENGFKWPRWAGGAERQAETKSAFEWLEKQGFRQRGHNLVWPAWKFAPKVARETAEKDTAAFRKLIEDDIRGKMAYTKGRVIAWDVINELVHEKDFFKYLPPDAAVQWFRIARELDPAAALFINEYGMLNSIASEKNIQEYLGVIAALRDAGAPIDAIGIQGHIGRQPRSPAQVITDLDMFRSNGLPVQITEFDINMTDEELQADYTRDFLIACYSHPVVTGFTMWGFWENAHWKPDAALFRKDWTPKRNAEVWRDLVTKQWKTNINKKSNGDGKVNARGHLGRYEITVTSGNSTRKVFYQLTKNSLPVVVKF